MPGWKHPNRGKKLGPRKPKPAPAPKVEPPRRFPAWVKKPKPDGFKTIPNWVKLRAKIIERDSWRCRICGNDWNLNVHHIDYDRSHNDDDNLVTLCVDCHRGIHYEGYKPILYEDWPVPWGDHPKEN